MLSALFHLARPALFALDPENAHEVTLRGLEAGIYPRDTKPDDALLTTEICRLNFPNPIGIAAGFDKDARVPDAVLDMGCGFAEVGTITPKPQTGNPTPRVFRLIDQHGLINRLGFNNGGHAAAYARLHRRTIDQRRAIVGVNIGANKDVADRAADYVAGLEKFWDVASYFMVNISSPNTPGLRDLQAPAALDELLGRVMQARQRVMALASAGPTLAKPVFVKIAPDIAADDLPAICARLEFNGVDGIAVSNTTLARPRLDTVAVAQESGGLSGRPLFHRSTVMLARVYQLTGGRIPLIGIGGIDSPETALAKIEAGATLLQLYTGLIYQGPGLIGRIKTHLADATRRANVTSIGQLTGTRAKHWAALPLDG